MLKRIVRKMFNTAGYDIVRIAEYPSDVDEEFIYLFKKCKNFTMTSLERMYALRDATQYIAKHKIPGDIVECGVWKGGSLMMCALTLVKIGDTGRNIYMYDTYTGMPEPSRNDKWEGLERQCLNDCKWTFASLEEVQKNMLATGYPQENILFVKGKVEDTIPGTIPERISLLRIDTDWYESTYHQLLHLFPRLSPHGVIIVDDYGYWRGAKEATDKYFGENAIKIFLNRIDNTGRIGIKPGI